MRSDTPRRSAIAFVLLTYGFSWTIVVPTGLLTSSVAIQFAAMTVAAFGPLFAAGILVWHGGSTVRTWFRDALAWRVPKRWYVAAIGVPLIGVVVQTVVYAVFFGDLDLAVVPRRLVYLLGTFPVAFLLTGGNEEFGWRGFMLPHLQRTYSALSASLVVGFVWLIWHLPSDVLMTALGSGWEWPLDRIAMRLAVIPLAIILTWIYNGTRGSVLVAMIFHAGWNSMSILVPVQMQTGGVQTASAPALSTLRIALVALMTVVALGIVLLYDRETLSTKEKHLGLAAG